MNLPLRSLPKLLIPLVLAGSPASAQAKFDRPQLRARLRLAVGETIHAAVSISLQPGWRLPWKNPSGTGVAPRLTWKLPPGWTVQPLPWPVPKALQTPEGLVPGYVDTVTFLAVLKPPAEDVDPTARIQVDLAWEVAKDAREAGQGSLATTLGSGVDRISPMELMGARLRLPMPPPQAFQAGPARAQREGDRLLVRIPVTGQTPTGFFPEAPEGFTASLGEVAVAPDGITVSLRPSGADARLSRLKGLVQFPDGAVEVDLPVPDPIQP